MSISKEIITVLDDLAKRFGVAIDWADKNVVPYVTELMDKFITYEIVLHSIPIVLFIISLLVWIPIVKSFVKAYKTDKDTLLFDGYDACPNGLGIGLLIANGFLTFLTFLLSGIEFGDLIKLIIIPELFIVEYIQTLL